MINTMKSSQIKTIASICTKLLVAICVIVAIATTMQTEGFMGGAGAFLYFTIQSNLWIGGICLIFAILQIVSLVHKQNIIPRWLYILKFMFTTSITLTFMVMTFMLTPALIMGGSGAYLATPSNIFAHYLGPIIAIVDYFMFDTEWKPQWANMFWSAIMPIYYLIFALVLGSQGQVFNDAGETFPYFFLDTEALGWFSTANPDGKYGVLTFGVFWWIIILTIFVLAMAFGYVAGLNAVSKSKFGKIPFSYEQCETTACNGDCSNCPSKSTENN